MRQQKSWSAAQEPSRAGLIPMSSITPQREVLRLAPSDPRLLRIEGERTLLERFEEPLRRALGCRRAYYQVQIYSVGRWGEVLVSILGTKGRLPLIFGREELEPGRLETVVRDAVEEFSL